MELPHQDGVRRILADISLELRRGEFLTVVGPSGTGKTTLLRVLGGLTASTRGAVHVNGRLIDGPPADVVIVFQDYSHALLQWRTVARNVAFVRCEAHDGDPNDPVAQSLATFFFTGD